MAPFVAGDGVNFKGLGWFLQVSATAAGELTVDLEAPKMLVAEAGLLKREEPAVGPVSRTLPFTFGCATD